MLGIILICLKMFISELCFFELLHPKPCRIIWKLHQKLSFGPEACEIGPKVGTWRETLRENIPFEMQLCEKMSFLPSRQRFLMVLTCSWVSWPKDDAERSRNFVKKSVLNPKRAKLIKNIFFMYFYEKSFWSPDNILLIALTCSWVFWPKNDTERIWNYLKKQVSEPSQQ